MLDRCNSKGIDLQVPGKTRSKARTTAESLDLHWNRTLKQLEQREAVFWSEQNMDIRSEVVSATENPEFNQTVVVLGASDLVVKTDGNML